MVAWSAVVITSKSKHMTGAKGHAFARLEDFDDEQPPPSNAAEKFTDGAKVPLASAALLPQRNVSFGGLVLPFSVAVHRVAMCTLAVALLWTTSLAASRSLANSFVTSPSFGSVVRECRRTYDEVHRQRDAHLACVRRQSDSCEVALQASLEEETRRAHASASANVGIVAAALERDARCSRSRLQALETMQRLQAAGVKLVWRSNGWWGGDGGANGLTCTSADEERARRIVGDIGAARGHAMDLATRYSQNAKLLQSLSLRHIDRSMAYDQEYLGSKKKALMALPSQLSQLSAAQASRLQSTLNQLNSSMRACSSPSSSSICQLPLQSQISQMRSQYDTLLTAMRQQQSELLNFHDAMDSMVGAIKPPLDAISSLARQIDPGIKLPSMSVPQVHLPEVHLPPLPSMEELKQELISYEAQRQADAQRYLHSALGSTDEWQEQLRNTAGGVGGILDDYQPPRFNTSEARHQMEGVSDRFLNEEESALNSFATLAPGAGNALNGSSIDMRNETFGLDGLRAMLSRTGLRFEPLSSTDVDVDLLSLAMGHVAFIATLCDFVWRAWRSVRLVLKYWSKASVGLPTLDLRDDQMSSAVANTCAELGKDPSRCLSSCLFSPLSGVGIALFAIFMIFNAATAVYMPTYFHYVEGCIDPPRSGTLLSRNLFSVSYNYAATEGNQQLLHDLNAYEARRVANCSAEMRDSSRQQRRSQLEADTAQASFLKASSDVKLMRSCLNLDELDEAAANAQVQPYLPLSAVLAADVCEEATATLPTVHLENGVYNCSAVAECESVCDGPSREITATFAQRCGCHAEWLAHGMVLHVLLAIFVFASINAWRVLLVDAACRLLWRELFAGQFEFLANCDDDGKPNVGRPQILQALREAIKEQTRTGWLLMLGAFAVNVPWVLSLQYVGEHLDVGHSAAPGSLV